jgi:hypothetical protein
LYHPFEKIKFSEPRKEGIRFIFLNHLDRIDWILGIFFWLSPDERTKTSARRIVFQRFHPESADAIKNPVDPVNPVYKKNIIDSIP